MNKDQYFDKQSYFEGKTSGYKFGGYELLNARIRWTPIIREITRFKKDGSILDVGCAYGYFLKFLPTSFRKYGVELSKEAIEYAHAQNTDYLVIYGDFLKTKFKKRYFDVITVFETLEHLHELSKTIKKIHTILKNDGYFFASFPIVESFLEKKWFTNFDETHINPSEKVLKEIKKQFKIIDYKYTFDCLKFILITKYRIAPVHQSYFLVCQKNKVV